jgi:uncharacterized protein
LIFAVAPWPPDGREADLNLGSEELAGLVADEGKAVPNFLSPLTGRLSLRLVGRRLAVKGYLRVEVMIVCDRCLSEARAVLTLEADEILELAGPGEKSDDEGQLEIVDGRFDLSPFLAELFWLAWPYRFICRPDCAGLCLRCGADLNEGLCGCSREDQLAN